MSKKWLFVICTDKYDNQKYIRQHRRFPEGPLLLYIESSVDGRVAEETLEQLNYICMHINGMFYELTVHCSIVHNLYNKFNVQ